MTPLGLQYQVALLLKPSIQIHAKPERVETVIRNDHQQGVLGPALIQHPAQEIVHALVEGLDRGTWVHAPLLMVHRRIIVDLPPECVLDTVQGVEHADTEAVGCLVERVKEHGLSFCVNVSDLLDECLIRQNVLIQGPGVFRQTQRGIGRLLFGQIT